MSYLMGSANTLAHLCSNLWVAELLSAETGIEIGEDFEEFNLHIDLGGMISVQGTPRFCIPHDDGAFFFYAHQRTAIRTALQTAVGSAGRDEFVKLNSRCFVLCITTEHALDLLLQIDSDEFIRGEVAAMKRCQQMVDSLRGDSQLRLAPQHDLSVN